MKDIKVLLIEHNERRFLYKDKIEQAIGSSNVVLIEEYDPEEIKSQLKNNYFDFVFTDAFFLPKGIPHDGSDQNEQFLLEEIVKIIRDFDKRTKVILFTQFNEKINGSQLDGVDYVFDKRYISFGNKNGCELGLDARIVLSKTTIKAERKLSLGIKRDVQYSIFL